MSEFDLLEKTLIGLGGGSAAVVALFKIMSIVKKEQVGQAGDDAVAKQFKALQDQIVQCQADNKALHLAFNQMSSKIHRQQTKLTRMEMLLRQFSGLVQQHGTPVPDYMQNELDDLIVYNSEKAMIVGEELMNRRSTDQ